VLPAIWFTSTEKAGDGERRTSGELREIKLQKRCTETKEERIDGEMPPMAVPSGDQEEEYRNDLAIR
jgi:hypothetical protein